MYYQMASDDDFDVKARAKRIMTMNLRHYVTENEHKTDTSSDGAIEAFSTGDSFDEEPDDVEEALKSAYGFNIHDLEPPMLKQLIDDMQIITIQANSVLSLQGTQCPDLQIVVSNGIAVIDQNSGEVYSRGKVLNLESFLFDQQLSAHTMSVCDETIQMAVLPYDKFVNWTVLKINYLRTRYTILSGLTDRALRKLHVKHYWHKGGDTVNLSGCIGLITHGVVKIMDFKSLLFAGSIAGVTEIMNEVPCMATAQTFVGVAIIDTQQFKKLMHQSEFQDAVNEINFQRSVLSEQLVTVADLGAHVTSLNASMSDALFTTKLSKSKDERDRVVLNQYTVLSKIGSGATASVFKARTHLNANCPQYVPKYLETVLKIIKRGSLESSIRREVDALTSLQHKNIIALQEIIDCEDCPVYIIVLEFASNGCLVDSILEHQAAKLVTIGVIDALIYMHDKRYIHNDIKPANILRTADNGIKLADFGCVSRIEDDVAPRGTPAFAAPENYLNKVTCETDIWSLGVTVYNLVHGFVPFRSSVSSTLKEAICMSELHFPSKIENNEDHVWLEELLVSILKKNPKQRSTLQEIRGHSWLMSRRRLSRKL